MKLKSSFYRKEKCRCSTRGVLGAFSENFGKYLDIVGEGVAGEHLQEIVLLLISRFSRIMPY